MQVIIYIIVFTLIGSIFSLAGGILLLLNKNTVKRFIHILSSFAAGALLGAAFFDLLPEGMHMAEETVGEFSFYLFVLVGIISFYLLERTIHWQHNHDSSDTKEPIIPMIVVGDTMHNLVDGIAIASAFLINIPLGIITAMVVALHEIPQEIGDFGVLLKKGLTRRKILGLNILSASVSLIGALLTFYFGSTISNLSVILIAISAGFFLYISLSNLIPEIHHENRRGFALAETLALIGGVVITYIAITSLHNFLPEHANRNEESIRFEDNRDYMSEKVRLFDNDH